MPTTKEIAQQEVTRPTPTRSETWLLTDPARRIMQAWGVTPNDTMGIFAVAELAQEYSKSEITRLAEEAEQEARENKGGISTYSKYYRASIVAAWLREKGQ